MSKGLRDWFWLLGMQVGLKGAYDCIQAFSETDFTEDLKKIDVPTLIAQGDDDQIVPFDDASAQSAKIVKDCTLRVYPGIGQGEAGLKELRDNPDAVAGVGVREIMDYLTEYVSKLDSPRSSWGTPSAARSPSSWWATAWARPGCRLTAPRSRASTRCRCRRSARPAGPG